MVEMKNEGRLIESERLGVCPPRMHGLSHTCSTKRQAPLVAFRMLVFANLRESMVAVISSQKRGSRKVKSQNVVESLQILGVVGRGGCRGED